MLYELTISEASKLIRDKKLSPVELTQSVLDRIDSVEPVIQAWVTTIREQALNQAKQAEREIVQYGVKGPLHGIPFGAKDLFYTEGIRTTAGSKVNADFIPNADATVISRLKQAGAIMLGKTTMTEYAFFGGAPATRNPWNLQHTPGGSSSGSAAALASSMALFTLGTQTAGSLSRPAAYNGVTTLKPTYGRVSRAGTIPGSWSLDHVGAFTKTVEDTALVLQVMAGFDRRDLTSLSETVPDYTISLAQDIKGMVLGIPDSFFFDGIHTEMNRAFEESVVCLRELGAEVVPISLPDSMLDANRAHSIVMKAEAASYHQDFYQKCADLYNPQLREMLEIGQLISATDYLRAQRIRQVFREDLIHLLSKVDVILTPASPEPAPKGLSYTGSPIFNVPFSNAGVPTLTLPAGFVKETGLPLGVQMVSSPLAESTLIRVGFSFQCATEWHHNLPHI
jgi:aspartyl-tRNA(Asn)/glutamyl-tRNA(Gln) amidotransferase subunit A